MTGFIKTLLFILLSASVAAQDQFAGRDKLRAHTNEFRKEVVRVTDGVYAAVGYSLGNAILIQGDGGSIIVDTLSNTADAREVKACLLYTSPSPRDRTRSRMPSSA